jgi:hypothetical protein
VLRRSASVQISAAIAASTTSTPRNTQSYMVSPLPVGAVDSDGRPSTFPPTHSASHSNGFASHSASFSVFGIEPSGNGKMTMTASTNPKRNPTRLAFDHTRAA